VSEQRLAELNFPISFTGPDGIGASPFDDYAEAERPDVGDDGQDPAYGVSVLCATQAALSDRLRGDPTKRNRASWW
jgi:hypothetical protein